MLMDAIFVSFIVFCLVYIYHGVFGERPYQLWAFMIAIISVAVYSIIQISSKRSTLLLVMQFVKNM